ncbi:hypothetical protein QE152_g8022 [Popillia japonica]|uniref:Reverse transcriptase domain-containing protein n=1 Tax=Popillia japonica TaxID=7064 RepID=A0AAW1MDL3_POPJA
MRGAWTSLTVLVPKPDGSIRLCIDHRKVNSITTPDLYPLPRLEDLLHLTGKSAYLSTMDLRSGYYQVEAHPPDRDKTAFICSNGIYCFRRLPFGPFDPMNIQSNTPVTS